MRSVTQMSSDIAAAAVSHFAEAAEPLLKPMIEGEKRFLSSDICIRMARRRGQDPAVIARQLLTSIRPAHGEHWIQHAGYLNITFTGQEFGPTNLEVSTESPRVTIFIASRPGSMPQQALLRLAAPAVLQAWLLKENQGEAQIILGDQTLRPEHFARLSDLWENVVTLATVQRQDGSVMHDQVLDIWRGHGSNQCCFFLFPGDVEHTLWRDGGREAGFDERVSVFIPDRGWLSEIDPWPGESSLFRDSPESCLSLLLHLCGGSRGVDIEWQSPRFSERKNMLWCLASTRQRLRDLISGISSAGTGPAKLPPDIEFLIRFQPEYYHWALRAGEVVPWVAATGALLERISALLNDPSLRIEARPGELPLARICPLLADATSKIYSFFHVD